MPNRKTYWHLAAAKRLPSDYEIATSRLLYHVDRGGFAVNVPASKFHARYQFGSVLTSGRWEEFADPRTTTYSKYVDLQRDAESHVNRLLAAIEDSEYDSDLSPGWIDRLGRILSPLRFLCHGLQMAAAYVGHMAPSGRIAVAALFQCGDEIRRIQRLAYRVALLARARPEIPASGRRIWHEDPAWQPLRRTIERLLVTYDWGEALVALNVCFKPIVDDLFLTALAETAESSGDHLDAQILRSLFEDCRWHRAWTDAFLALALSENSANQEAVRRWVEARDGEMEEATRAAAAVLGIDPVQTCDERRARLRFVLSIGSGPRTGLNG
jgi:toluene monooxygenase system protein E